MHACETPLLHTKGGLSGLHIWMCRGRLQLLCPLLSHPQWRPCTLGLCSAIIKVTVQVPLNKRSRSVDDPPVQLASHDQERRGPAYDDLPCDFWRSTLHCEATSPELPLRTVARPPPLEPIITTTAGAPEKTTSNLNAAWRFVTRAIK